MYFLARERGADRESNKKGGQSSRLKWPRPKAIIEKFAKVPPENTSKSDKRGLPAKSACKEVLEF